MTNPNLDEVAPLFLAYGHAVFDAQSLERSLLLLLLVVDQEREKSGLAKLNGQIDGSNSKKTLGTLFKEVLTVEYITDAEKKLIWDAIRDRNILIHSYWDEQKAFVMLTTDGRGTIINDLIQRRDRCRKADDIVVSFIDKYLKKYGFSIDSLPVSLFEEHWQNDEEPPEEILH